MEWNLEDKKSKERDQFYFLTLAQSLMCKSFKKSAGVEKASYYTVVKNMLFVVKDEE